MLIEKETIDEFQLDTIVELCFPNNKIILQLWWTNFRRKYLEFLEQTENLFERRSKLENFHLKRSFRNEDVKFSRTRNSQKMTRLRRRSIFQWLKKILLIHIESKQCLDHQANRISFVNETLAMHWLTLTLNEIELISTNLLELLLRKLESDFDWLNWTSNRKISMNFQRTFKPKENDDRITKSMNQRKGEEHFFILRSKNQLKNSKQIDRRNPRSNENEDQ